jgi:fructose-1,6-bisphosphatase/inositol monophosphatase family enzyme
MKTEGSRDGGNVIAPAILALEAAGYRVTKLSGELLEAGSPEGRFVAGGPVALLG